MNQSMERDFRPLKGLDNLTVSIYTKINELAERHGLRPYDYVAVVKGDPGYDLRVDFEDHPTGDAKTKRYDSMLRDLGIPDDGRFLQGDVKHIIDALDNALQLAPKPRLR